MGDGLGVGDAGGSIAAAVCEAFISAAEAVPVQADGEIVARLPVKIGVADRPVRLVRP